MQYCMWLSLSCSGSAGGSASAMAAIIPVVQGSSNVMESVVGVTDWDFLKTRRHSEQDAAQGKVVIKRPCLEDFGGELAVFTVYTYMHISMWKKSL